MASVDFLIARLPVFDRWLKVRAYELRVSARSRGAVDWLARLRTDNDQDAHSKGVEFFETLTGGKLALMRLAMPRLEELQLGALPGGWLLWPQFGTHGPENGWMNRLQGVRMNQQGLVIDAALALDNKDALDMADVLALDMRADRRIMGSVTDLTPRKPLLAVGVDMEEDFLSALRLGCELFQGRFYVQPKLEAGLAMPAFRLNLMKLLVAVHSPELDYSLLERLVSQDVSLAYKLLRYINSPYFGVKVEVKSIQQAFTLLGEKALRNWVSLVALHGAGKEKPDELLVLSLVRAMFFSEIAELCAMTESREEAFLAGLFSLLDAFFDKTMEELLEEIPLSTPVKEALLCGTGPLGPVEGLARAYERAKWEEVDERSAALSLDPQTLLSAYTRSVEEAHELFAR